MAAVVPRKDNQLRVVECAAGSLDTLVRGLVGDAIGRRAEIDVGTTEKRAAVGNGVVVNLLETLRYGRVDLVVNFSSEGTGGGIAVVCFDIDEDVDGGCACDGERATRGADGA